VPADLVGAIVPLGSWSRWRPQDLQPRQRQGFQSLRSGRPQPVCGPPPCVVTAFLPVFCLAEVLSAVLTGGQPRETDQLQ
jgi:hypothetical protein